MREDVMTNKSKHTPGPWYWSNQYKTISREPTWSLIGEGGYGILSCDGEENSPHGINNESNASLIAVAPELLEALERMVALFDSGAWSHANVKDARAAIAKAMGEA